MSRKCPKTDTYVHDRERELPENNRTVTTTTRKNMATGSVAILIVFEPNSMKRAPVPIARVDDPRLTGLAVSTAIAAAEARASSLTTETS